MQQPRGALVAGVRQRFRQMRNARRKVARGFLFADFLRIVNARRHARLNGVQFVRRLADECFRAGQFRRHRDDAHCLNVAACQIKERLPVRIQKELLPLRPCLLRR